MVQCAAAESYEECDSTERCDKTSVNLNMGKPRKATSRTKRNPWLEGISKVLECDESLSKPDSIANVLERGDNPYLAGLETIPLRPANSGRARPKRARHSREVARFENDFAVAIIPQRNSKQHSLTIEPELRNLVKKIIAAGGRMPRTQLRKDKTDTWQPEKLLKSKIAKALINAGLLGTNKSGRTSVFWAKQQAK